MTESISKLSCQRAFFVMVLAAASLLQGCSLTSNSGTSKAMLNDSQPVQAYSATSRFPADVQTVAVLPVTVSTDLNSGYEDKAAAIITRKLPVEVQSLGIFRPTMISSDLVEKWTGRMMWSLEDELPLGFLETIARESGCDAILFSEVTEYRPYQHPAVGLRFNLIRASEENMETIWQMDHLFELNPSEKSYADRDPLWLERQVNLNRILDLPEGHPAVRTRSHFPLELFVQAALRTSFQTIPRR